MAFTMFTLEQEGQKSGGAMSPSLKSGGGPLAPWPPCSAAYEIYLKNYDFCENVKFGTISWKIDILSITA